MAFPDLANNQWCCFSSHHTGGSGPCHPSCSLDALSKARGRVMTTQRQVRQQRLWEYLFDIKVCWLGVCLWVRQVRVVRIDFEGLGSEMGLEHSNSKITISRTRYVERCGEQHAKRFLCAVYNLSCSKSKMLIMDSQRYSLGWTSRGL